MGRFCYWMNISVDNFIEREDGEDGGGSWMRIDEELHAVFNAKAREFVLTIEGRVVYEIMEQFWPDARTDQTQPEVFREYAHIWTDQDKILLSNTRTEAQHNTRIIGGDDAIAQLAEIRRNTDGLIGVGGANVASQLASEGLLDELWLFTHPAILGRGRPLLDPSVGQLELDLLEQETYSDSVTFHRWAVRGTSA